MCGIAFKRKQEFKDYFDIAHSRGTDGLWVIVSGGSVTKWYADSLTSFSTLRVGARTNGTNEFEFNSEWPHEWELKWNVSWWDIYQSMMNTILRFRNKNEYALIHHRKTSIGTDSLDNVHPFPFCNGQFFLLQNGSSQIMHDWGIINYLSEVKTHSDTYYLSKFLEEKGCKSLNDIADTLGKLVRSWVNLGVICVVDTTNDTILLLSDGCRSLHVELDMTETIVEWFSSLTDKWEDDYFFKWFILFDFQWNIYNIKYEYLNKVIVKTQKPLYPVTWAYWDWYSNFDDYYPDKKKVENMTLSNFWESKKWNDITEGNKEVDWIDPALIIDSEDLTQYMNTFWETESDLSERRLAWIWQGQVYDLLIKRLATTANLIRLEMNELANEFYSIYPETRADGIWEYVEAESMNVMNTVLEYNDNFEFED